MRSGGPERHGESGRVVEDLVTPGIAEGSRGRCRLWRASGHGRSRRQCCSRPGWTRPTTTTLTTLMEGVSNRSSSSDPKAMSEGGMTPRKNPVAHLRSCAGGMLFLVSTQCEEVDAVGF